MTEEEVERLLDDNSDLSEQIVELNDQIQELKEQLANLTSPSLGI